MAHLRVWSSPLLSKWWSTLLELGSHFRRGIRPRWLPSPPISAIAIIFSGEPLSTPSQTKIAKCKPRVRPVLLVHGCPCLLHSPPWFPTTRSKSQPLSQSVSFDLLRKCFTLSCFCISLGPTTRSKRHRPWINRFEIRELLETTYPHLYKAPIWYTNSEREEQFF